MSGGNVVGPSLANTPGVNQTNILNAVVPPEGPKSLAVVLDFTSATQITVDLTITTSQGKISTVQMVYADNYANTAPLVIAVAGTSQTVRVPPGFQGWFPVVATNRPKLVFSTAAGIVLTCLLLNVPVAQGLWAPNDSNARSGAIAPLATAVTTGGTAVAVFSSTAPSIVPSDGAVIVNPKAASESLFVDIVNNADTVAPGAQGTTIELAAGDAFTVPPGFVGQVTANAVTNGHTFSAYGVGHT